MGQEGEKAVEYKFKDKKSENDFVAFYKSLEQRDGSDDVIRLFDRRVCHSAYGKNALFLAREYFHTETAIKKIGNEQLESISLTTLMYEKIVHDILLVRGMKLEIWEPYSQGRTHSWRVARRGSPGNTQDFEDILLEGDGPVRDDPVVASIKIVFSDAQRILGVAFANTTQRRIGVTEILDNDRFSNLEALLNSIAAKECIMHVDKKDADFQKVFDILNAANISLTEKKKSDFRTTDIEQDLDRLLENGINNNLAELDLKHAMGSCAALLNYLELMTDENNHGQYKMNRFDLDCFMKLDTAGVNALNLMPSSSDVNKNSSIYGLLNKCKTKVGSRRLLQWVRQPLRDFEAIQRRHDLVEAFCEDTILRQTLQEECLRGVPDLDRMVKKFQRNRGKLADCVHIYKFVLDLPNLIEALLGYQGGAVEMVKPGFIEPLQQCKEDLVNLQTLIEGTIDLSDAAKHEYHIQAEYDSDLQQLKEAKDEMEEEMQELANQVTDELGLDKPLKLDRSDKYGFFFKISRKEQKHIRNNPRFRELQVAKDGVKFDTQTLRHLGRQYAETMQSFLEKQAELESETLRIVASYIPVFEELSEIISELDILISFAHVSMNAPTPYVRPKMIDINEHDNNQNDSGIIDLKGSRHPCVELQDDVSFIPNDAQLKKGESSLAVITGPNMGGKSTYIRQVGVIVLLAQIGCFVPCDEATLSVCDSILARIGASDSQLRGVSTFMAEMLETSSILTSATKHSLIIIDELGRGTSTFDGFGLAWAISEHIAAHLNSFCLFATHFHELTTLADEQPNVTNLHVSAIKSNDTISMTYRVNHGPCDQSFGIHVAEMAKFPEQVVRLAKRKAFELETFDEETNHANKRQRQLNGNGNGNGNGNDKVDPVREQGVQSVRRFMQHFAEMPIETLESGEILENLRMMKQQVDNECSSNSFVSSLIAQ